MAAADADAVMVTQGWFLSAVPRPPWGEKQARAFLHGPPHGKLLVLDLNAIANPVWSRTKSFYGTPFALSMLHNFGERPGLFGRMPELVVDPPRALANSVPGSDVGLGMTPEGARPCGACLRFCVLFMFVGFCFFCVLHYYILV